MTNQSDLAALAACPFCGRAADWHAGSDNENWAGATCKFCGVTRDDHGPGCMDRTAKVWNTRALAARLPEGDDSKRLDFLDAGQGTIRFDHDPFVPGYVHWGDATGCKNKTVREAIDKMMEASAAISSTTGERA